MSNWFRENGQLNEDGLKALEDFRKALDTVLTSAEVQGMSFSEVHALQSNMSKMVGDNISKLIREK
jgi:hypothetical protein